MKHDVNGVLLLDKPAGFTSNEALQIVKNLFKASKAGHTGSLDPSASGMLPICFGEATKFSQFLLEASKLYHVTGKLGETTASGDAENEVLKRRAVENISIETFDMILSQFRGEILQTPPMYSAIKYKGQPLYKLARQGIEVKRNSREINVYKLQLLEFANNFAVFEIYCSKGTYIRTLIVDVGEALGCGAHVVSLRRLAVGPYQAYMMVTLDKLRELAIQKSYHHKLNKYLLPIESMLVGMPEVILTRDMIHYAILGQAIVVSHVPKSGWVQLKDKNGNFLGVGEVLLGEKISPRRMIKF
ncbi:MAG: tRNA pseudouridine(55) synthase TruB [Coxiellaceae bacterium]|jgi:tRNA pseudouridine55 synthase|nr:tRNA pseudouridine(55) synthase TruB [Coxiellaceae bacterium]